MYENKYLSIYEELVEKIQSGQLKPSTKLPSENELVKEYVTSRETVRKALTMLSQNGYIKKLGEKVRMYWMSVSMTFRFPGWSVLKNWRKKWVNLGVQS